MSSTFSPDRIDYTMVKIGFNWARLAFKGKISQSIQFGHKSNLNNTILIYLFDPIYHCKGCKRLSPIRSSLLICGQCRGGEGHLFCFTCTGIGSWRLYQQKGQYYTCHVCAPKLMNRIHSAEDETNELRTSLDISSQHYSSICRQLQMAQDQIQFIKKKFNEQKKKINGLKKHICTQIEQNHREKRQILDSQIDQWRETQTKLKNIKNAIIPKYAHTTILLEIEKIYNRIGLLNYKKKLLEEEEYIEIGHTEKYCRDHGYGGGVY